MKTRNIITFSGIVVFFLFCHSANCPWSKDDEYVDLCFTVEPETGNTNTVFTFNSSCTDWEADCPEATFYWSFGDGTEETTEHDRITHKYNAPGEYLISLIKVECFDYDGDWVDRWTKSYRDWVTVEDASGNESPNAAFTMTPQQGTTATTFTFDASYCSDTETPVEQLQVRWDWTTDGTYDTPYSTIKEAQHQFIEGGTFTITLEVKDTEDKTDHTSKEVQVTYIAPPVAAFTIDPFEGNTLTVFTFDASASSDIETPPENLLVAWDFENDGIWDTELASEKIAHHQYPAVGQYEIKLRVQDTDQLEDYEMKYLDVINCIDGGEPCQVMPVVNYGGKIYNTVQIGDQCWFRENLDIGTRINSVDPQTNNQLIEKYCYDNLDANCDTYGGLYQWDEMMDYSEESGTRGICPDGWHIPTDMDFDILAQTLGGNETAGSKLKSCTDWFFVPYLINTNESGFTGLPAGYCDRYHQFLSLTQRGEFWTSDSEPGERCHYRSLGADDNHLDGQGEWYHKEGGFSVRCIKD